MTELYGAMARGAVWLTALRLSERALGLANTVVLARLLAPQDFGLVAMCMVVVAALETFTNFSFDVVLIQRQDATKAHYDTAFTMNVIVGAGFGAILAASATFVAAFYGDERLQLIMYIVAANFAVRSLENIAIVDFRKHFQFHLEAILRLSVKAVGLLVAIPAALILHNYWALVIGMSAMAAFDVVLSFAMRPYRPSLTLSQARSIMSFSGWLMLNNVVFFLKAQIHNVFIGRLLGARDLGTFNMANEVAMMSSSELVAPINRAVYPGYAKLGGDPESLKATFLDVFSLIMMISFPAALGTVAVANDLAPLLLGSSWTNTIPLMKLIAICGALNALNSNMAYVVHAVGKPRLATRVAVTEAVIMIPLMYMSILRWGLVGAGWSLVAAYGFVSTPMWWRTITRLLDLPVTQLLARVWRPLVASVSMYFAVLAIQLTLGSQTQGFVVVLISVVVGAVAYVTLLFFFWLLADRPRGGEAIVVAFLRERAGRAFLPST